MGLFKNGFKLDYKKRPFDGYKSIVDQLDEETKQKIDRQRTIGMVCVVVFVFILIVILAVTGIGINKDSSATGNIFGDKENVLIECFGDSLTEGYLAEGSETDIAEITYPAELRKKLMELLQEDENTYKMQTLDVKNYGQAGSILQESSYTRLSGTADIVVILYTANNFAYGKEYVNTLETNIETIRKQGSQVFLMNYPIAEGSAAADKISQANNYIASVAESLDVVLIDLKSYFDSLFQEYTTEELFGSDLQHLTSLGYSLMGDQAAECIYDYYCTTYYN